MNKPVKVEIPNNLRLWEVLGKTDPEHTKAFKRGGGFSGTAIKPIWVIKRLTEEFGPCGEGWGIGEPRFEVVHAQNGDVLVYCTVSCWHGSPENTLYGVGGDKAAGTNKHGPFTDDEAFKKAFTDAVNNAFKFVGVAADIHMGLFDDNKYVEEVREEFHEIERQKVPGIHKIKQRLGELMKGGNATDDLEAFNALVTAHRDDLQTIKDANHEWWTGDGEDFEGFKAFIKHRREELAPKPETTQFQFLTSLVTEATSSNELQAVVNAHGDAIGELDGEESRRFETLFDGRAAALKQLDTVTAGA